MVLVEGFEGEFEEIESGVIVELRVVIEGM